MRSVADASRPIASSPPVNEAKASLTTTWAMRTASGPSLRTVSSMMPGTSRVRSTASASAGGPRRSPRPGAPSSTNAPMAAASSRSGSTPSSHAGAARGSAWIRRSSVDASARESVDPGSEATEARDTGNPIVHLEEALPAELRELGLVGVEHEAAGPRKAELGDSALALALHDGVRVLRRLERRARREVAEEVPVDVEGVQEAVLERVDEVDPHELVARDLDRPLEVGEADRVHRVDLVRAVEVRVEPVHHHHQLVRVRPSLTGIDDEGAIEPLGDVLGERARVAVVEVQAEGRGVELVHRPASRRDHPAARTVRAVRRRGVEAVEVDRVRVVGAVDERHAHALALARAQRGPGDAAVVAPGREPHARGELDLLVAGDEGPLAQDAPAREPPRGAAVEVTQERVRVEAVGG